MLHRHPSTKSSLFSETQPASTCSRNLGVTAKVNKHICDEVISDCNLGALLKKTCTVLVNSSICRPVPSDEAQGLILGVKLSQPLHCGLDDGTDYPA